MKNDRCDVDWRVAKLVRVGHHLWHLRAKLGAANDEKHPIWESLETVWRLKRELKQEVAKEKRASFERNKHRFAR